MKFSEREVSTAAVRAKGEAAVLRLLDVQFNPENHHLFIDPVRLRHYFDSSIQSSLLKGLKTVSKATGEAIAKVPVISKGPVDEALIEAGSKLDRLGTRRSVQQLKKLVDRQSSCVRPFVDNIETVDRLYNNAISMVFDKDTLYLGAAEEE